MKIRKQEDIKDCGLVVLQSLYHYYHSKWINLSDLKKETFYNQDGIVIKNLQTLSEKHGIKLEAFHIDFEALSNLKSEKPSIILINEGELNHYVIFLKIDKNFVYLLDPLVGKRKIEIEFFKKIFVNIILTTEKIFDPKTKAIKQKNPLFLYIWNEKSITIFLLIIVCSILTFSSSFFLKNVINKAIYFNNISILIKLTIVFGWILLFRFLQNILKSLFLKNLQMVIEENIMKNFIFSLKSAQNSQLFKLDTSDYIKRFNIIPSFASFISNFAFTLVSEISTFIFAFFIILFLNWKLFLITFLIGFIFFMFSFIEKKVVNSKYNDILKSNASLNSSYYKVITNFDKLKKEDFYKMINKDFESKYKKLKEKDFHLWKINFIFKNFQKFLIEFLPIILTFICALFVIKGEFKLGDMILFITFFAAFVNPLNSISDLIVYYPIFLEEYDLLKFILFIEKEKNGTHLIEKIKSIQLENIDYKPNNIKSILKINNLEINNNLILKGQNGSGKSTLLKILNLDLESNFKINNLPILHFDKSELRKKIIYINKESFSSSIDVFGYITKYNPQKVDTFLNNYSFYELDKLFIKWQIDLKTEIKENWVNFSEGQKQIISILQLLCQEFDLILLDEAFENISMENFEILKKIILNFQKEEIFIEVSHSNKYLNESEIFDLDKEK
ncbi:Mbov_0121 family peptidase domain-containing ABC transporter [Mycoplasma sp. 5370]